ncbi:glycosyltransferase 87 family protein [Actinacidiphila acididurans]|uniref:glycosyltransferase 87 family protein n=1 Tax=Actinacidiphila acididurans TaxID=2784346 RepID=UPI0027DE3CA7|nr:glycosyltransferase 87 family protein [Actinacidiphila acididurans]
MEIQDSRDGSTGPDPIRGTGADAAAGPTTALSGEPARPARRSPGPFPGRSAGPGGRWAVPVLVLLLVALTAEVAATVAVGGTFGDPRRLPYWYAGAWLLFAAALLVVRKVPRRAATVLVVTGAAALALAGLVAPPRTSDDMYRYVWDGTVQSAGISPYAYSPDAPEPARLRGPWLFPPVAEGPDPCPGWDSRPATGGVCTRINRPAVHTIYPPVAEGWFLLVHELSPSGARHKPMQLGGAALALATTGALLLALRRRGGDPRGAALWAWCPLVPVAAVNDAHVDTLGVLLTVLALGVATAPVRRGALLGAAIAVKLLPGLVMPGALARRPRREWLRLVPAAVAVVALTYLPYVLASGAGVLGYLPGYLHEEGYEPGAVHRFALLRLVLPDAAAGPAALAAIAVTALYVLLRGDPRRPWHGALIMTGITLLLTSPSYYWYGLLVVALAAFENRWEWLAVPLAGLALYTGGEFRIHGDTLQTLVYAGAALIVTAGTLTRHLRRLAGATDSSTGPTVAPS